MKAYWAIRVGYPSNGYVMDNKVFDTKREAAAYRDAQGDVSWQKDWHIVKLREVK
jgi:hypothetical protein